MSPDILGGLRDVVRVYFIASGLLLAVVAWWASGWWWPRRGRAFAVLLAALLFACSPDPPAPDPPADIRSPTVAESAFLRSLLEAAAETHDPVVGAAPLMWVQVANLRPVSNVDATFQPGASCVVGDGRLVELVSVDEEAGRATLMLPRSVLGTRQTGLSCPDETRFEMLLSEAP